MTKEEFRQLAKDGPLILDGATGSNLLKMGMPRGIATELWVYDHPEVMAKLQSDYIAAGSRVIYAPTFMANRISLSDQHFQGQALTDKVRELILTAVQRSKETAGEKAFVAGDIGGTGRFMEPNGPLTYEDLFDCYAEAIGYMKEAGVDLLVAETMLSLEEVLVVVDAAAAAAPDLPLVTTLTCQADGGLFFGGTIYEACEALAETGADAVGCNCSVGPDQLEAVVRTISSKVDVPVVAKPNAGMPEITDTGEAIYSMDPEAFGQSMLGLKAAGARLLGGCCGTDPDYIRSLTEKLAAEK